MIRQMDKDGNGKIEFPEFCNGMESKVKELILNKEDDLADLRIIFQEADFDHNGYLEREQLAQCLRN